MRFAIPLKNGIGIRANPHPFREKKRSPPFFDLEFACTRILNDAKAWKALPCPNIQGAAHFFGPHSRDLSHGASFLDAQTDSKEVNAANTGAAIV